MTTKNCNRKKTFWFNILQLHGLTLALFFVSLKISAQTNLPQEQDYHAHLLISEQLSKSNIDSALYHALEAQKQIRSNDPLEDQLKIYITLGSLYMAKGDMSSALNNFLEAQKHNNDALGLDEGNPQLILNHSDILMKIGGLHYYQREYDKCLSFYERSLSSLESILGRVDESKSRPLKTKIFNNIAGVFIQKQEFEKALSYFKSALEMNSKYGSREVEGSLTNNIGICYLERKESDLANHYFLKSLDIRNELGDSRGKAQVLNNLAKNLVYQGRFRDALEYYVESLSLSKETGNVESTLITLESLSNVYDTLGMHQIALKTYKEFKALNDSTFSIESKLAISKIEESYKRANEEKVLELEAKKKAAEHQKTKITYITIRGALFFLLLTSVLLIFLQKGKIRNQHLLEEKLKLESAHLRLEKQTLEDNLEFKERELTANALFLLKNNELITRITENLLKAKSALKEENQAVIQGVIHELQSSQDKHIWNEFEAHFTKVHSQFYDKLQEKFPNLTPNEKKLCAFLRLNMSTKDISAITYQSVNSITVARSRLRKKLNIEGEDIQLMNFLMTL